MVRDNHLSEENPYTTFRLVMDAAEGARGVALVCVQRTKIDDKKRIRNSSYFAVTEVMYDVDALVLFPELKDGNQPRRLSA